MSEEKKNVSEETQAAEKFVKEKLEELKLKYSAKVNVLVSDKELQTKLHEVVAELTDEAMTLGCATELTENGIEQLSSYMKDFIGSVSSPTDAARATMYKNLYHNQRIITSHLQAAAQILQLQVGEYELLGEDPFLSPLSRAAKNTVGTIGSAFAPFVMEKAN